MPRNSQGVYSAPSGTTAVTKTTISSQGYNTFLTDIASAMTNSLNVQGTAAMQAALNMGSNKIVSLADPTNPQDAATLNYLTANYFPKSGGFLTGNLALSVTGANNVFLTLNKGQSGQANEIVGDTNGSNRWIVEVGDTEAESGSNNGSNFTITACSDTGAVLQTPFLITRSTGLIYIFNGLNLAGGLIGAGAVSLSGTVSLSNGLSVTAGATSIQSLAVALTSVFTGAATFNGGISVSGAAATISNGLTVAGTATFANGFAVSGSLGTFSAGLTVSAGAISLSSSSGVTISGASATISNGVAISGTASFANGFTVSGAAGTFNNGMSVSGNASFASGTFGVSGAATLSGGLTVSAGGLTVSSGSIAFGTTPTSVTPGSTDNSTNVATTAFVNSAAPGIIAGIAFGSIGSYAGASGTTGTVPGATIAGSSLSVLYANSNTATTVSGTWRYMGSSSGSGFGGAGQVYMRIL